MNEESKGLLASLFIDIQSTNKGIYLIGGFFMHLYNKVLQR